MAISFNKDSVFNLRPVDDSKVRKEVSGFLIEGENVIMVFATVRDQVIFTNKRIIAVDVQGMTGVRKSFTTLPYSKIQFFSVQTPGLIELVSDAELFIMFSNGYTAKFEFRGSTDIGAICRAISEYTLEHD